MNQIIVQYNANGLKIRSFELCLLLICSLLLLISFGRTVSAWESQESKELHKQPFLLSEESDIAFLGPWLQYFEDETREIEIAEIVDEKWTFNWAPMKVNTLNKGYTNSVFWFKGKVLNEDINPIRGFIDVGNPILDRIDYFVFSDGVLKHIYYSGDLFPISDRAIVHRNFLFPFYIEPGEELEIYLRVDSSSSIQVPIRIASELNFFIGDAFELSGKSLYYGVMIVMMLFNLFLFVSLREIVYLYYVLFIFGFVAQQFNMHGMMAVNFLPEKPDIQSTMVVFFMPFCILFACLFTHKFLSLNKNAPRLSWFYKFWIGAAIIMCFAVPLIGFEVAAKLSAFSAVIVSFACVFTGPYIWYKGHLEARFYSIAWFSVALGSGILALNKLGFIPRTGFTENALLVGSALEALLLSIALADRLNRERDSRFEAQRVAIEESESRKVVEEKLVYSATHNSIVQVPNRVFFENWFANLEKKEEAHLGYVLAMLHPNRFHEINQTLGHSIGDDLFKIIVARANHKLNQYNSVMVIESQMGQSFKVAVVEGISLVFVIDLEANNKPEETIHAVIEDLKQPIEYQSMMIDIGVSAGWSNFPHHAANGSELIRNALIAIDVGGTANGTITRYSNEINPYSERRLVLVGELKKAIEENALVLYYQPQLSVKNNQINGLEALLRWKHPVFGFVSPEEFIPVAEQSGIINPLTDWVLKRAISDISNFDKWGVELHLAINISAVNLRNENFASSVKRLLIEYNVEAKRLVLEVTETAIMNDPELALKVLEELSELGITISIDDFGTGHSSLSYIKKLPLKEIKIDRSFVMDMVQSKDDELIVNTTINMCHGMGLEVVAEGVESIEIAERLKNMNCDVIQGYALSKPMPLIELITWMEQEHGLFN